MPIEVRISKTVLKSAAWNNCLINMSLTS